MPARCGSRNFQGKSAINKSERFSRRNNIRIVGIPESNDEDCVPLVEGILKDKFAYDIKVERAHREGKQIEGRSRNILFKTLSYRHKIDLMKNQRVKLADEPYYMTDDLTFDDLAEKKKWSKAVQDLYQRDIKLRFFAGTIVAGFAVFCCANPGQSDGGKVGTFCLNFWVGILQLFLTLFIVGWIWAIIWGTIMVAMSAEYHNPGSLTTVTQGNAVVTTSTVINTQQPQQMQVVQPQQPGYNQPPQQGYNPQMQPQGYGQPSGQAQPPYGAPPSYIDEKH